MGNAGREKRDPWENRVPDGEPGSGVFRRLFGVVLFVVAPDSYRPVQIAVLWFWALVVIGAVVYAAVKVWF